MNLNKSLEFFDPKTVGHAIHIIGCGAIGSTIAENLARLGISKIHLWDFDIVTSHNITNQMFLQKHINKPKVTALTEILKEINPEITIIPHGHGWDPEKDITNLTGYVFLCVDSIETRKAILDANKYNTFIKAIFDNRMRLTDAQHYASSWQTKEQKDFLFNTMDFTDEEAKDSTPVSACGTTLSVCYTVRAIAAAAVANFVNKVNNNELQKTILVNFDPVETESFKE